MKWSRKTVMWWGVPSLCLLIIIAGAFFLWPKSKSHSSAKVDTLANHCPGPKSAEFKCQKEYYQLAYEQGGITAAFTNLKSDFNQNPSVKSNCHQLTHVIGRASGNKHSDVAKAYAEGDPFCWSGFYHGVMEAILQRYGDDVRSKLNEVCSGISKDQKYSFYHYNCAHGIGHGVMLIEGDELFVSLKTCDNLTDSWERQSCYGGAFMENIMAEVNPDHHTNYLKADQPMYPCTAVDNKYKEQCYLMQTSHALTVVNRDFGKVFELCGQTEEPFRATCWQSLGRDAAGNSNNTVGPTHDTCMLGPTDESRKNCVIGAVKDFVSNFHGIKEATELCGTFPGDLAATCEATKKDYYKAF